MNRTKSILVAASFLFALALTLSCSDSDDENDKFISCQLSNGNCITSLNTSEQCYAAGGQVIQFCPGYDDPSNGSGTPSTTAQTANAVILTLTSWQTKDTDAGGLDPHIYFRVIAYRDKKIVSDNKSGVLLDAQDIAATWSGSKRSSAVPFVPQADSLIIRAVVLEKDLLANDDISPGYYTVWKTIPTDGHSGSDVMEYGSGKSRVGYKYEFIRQ